MTTKNKIIYEGIEDNDLIEEVNEAVETFVSECAPLEKQSIFVLPDRFNDAVFCECHVKASKLLKLSTVDVALDPEEQGEYRANRDLVEDHAAFARMKADANKGRSFSNIVAEFLPDDGGSKPLKIIGGQHRYTAIQEAFDNGTDEYHGIKVYFGLDSDQRLDVQLISNTNIAVSTDLLDRMYETLSGPQLRDWCHETGLLSEEEDFADKRQRGNPLTVRAARVFIINYMNGREVDPKKIESTRTTPTLVRSGEEVPEWTQLKIDHPNLWEDKKLLEAGKEFAKLIEAQRVFFKAKKGAKNADFSEKAMNYAVLSAWAFVAGMLHKNPTRLKRHYDLRKAKGGDPLNAAALAKGRHKTDSDNYRGLGYRTDSKERGRFVELFYLQTEKGDGIKKASIEVAIMRYHAKQAVLDAREAEAKL